MFIDPSAAIWGKDSRPLFSPLSAPVVLEGLVEDRDRGLEEHLSGQLIHEEALVMAPSQALQLGSNLGWVGAVALDFAHKPEHGIPIIEPHGRRDLARLQRPQRLPQRLGVAQVIATDRFQQPAPRSARVA